MIEKQMYVCVCFEDDERGSEKGIYSQNSERDTDSEMSQRPDL